MKILLLGEYSNVHNTLALGLRKLGHDVTVASDGDGWKSYPRDVDLTRHSLSPWSSLAYLLRVYWHFRSFRGFDVVQLINPEFLKLRAEKIWPFYQYLRKHNKHVVMGAFGMDYYYAKACLDLETFRYSDFNLGKQERISEINEQFKREWIDGAKGELTQRIANDCDAIVAGLYEYYVSYQKHYAGAARLTFIPFPIQQLQKQIKPRQPDAPLKLFIGIQRQRSIYKGTDIMLRAARRIAEKYPDECILQVAENFPFAKYVEMLNGSEVILDQLYAYTPAMNALEAMARGLIVVGGGEPENYEILQEAELRPIINVQPNEYSVFNALDKLITHRNQLIESLQRDSIEYINRHHDYIKVAERYETLYKSLN